jgi:antitoxin (DNA-binding transcriptional repressor) of toxin-antitoxin stability system
MKEVALSDVKDDLSRYLRQAAKEEIVIPRHGKAAGLLIGFESEDDWIDYRLEHDARFLSRIAAARASLRAGRGARLEDLEAEEAAHQAAASGRGQKRTRAKRGAPGRGRSNT